ncbi:MAG: beta-galactosidase [Verrucomicrobiota bacterium]
MENPLQGLRKKTHSSLSGLSEFLFGAPYYPEHWDEDDMAQDPKRMREAGFNVARMAEFAWDRMEPQEGTYDFSFFDDHIDRIAQEGIKTILCTPTAAPPRWMTVKYPEILRAREDGVRLQHGSRQHACHSSSVFREFSQKITQAMADHYRGNENVIGWQTDNEFFCHFRECHCPNCQEAFKVYLENKYGTIDELNRRWGTSFWSLTFSAFSEIETPKQMCPTHVNPSQHLDYLLFLSKEVISFQREQVNILRAANSDWFVFHNGIFMGIDYREFAEDLDFMAVDVYPKFSKVKDRRFNADWTLDMTRSFSGNFIVPELQSGPGGQGNSFHDNPLPGEMRLYAYQCIARGADGILHFRWRTCRFGAEEFWCGILDHDNIPRRRFTEVCQEGKEFRAIGDQILRTSLFPEIGILADSGIAEMVGRTNGCGLPGMNSGTWCWLTAWSERNYHVGLVHPDDDLSGFRVLVLPSWEIVSDTIAKRLEYFVDKGGTLIVTGRSGIKNEDNHVIKETAPGNLRGITGSSIYESSRVNDPEEHPNGLDFGDFVLDQDFWTELIESDGAETIATWTQGHLKGRPAAVVNKRGKGKCFYIGTFVQEVEARKLVSYFANALELDPMVSDLSSGVHVSRRDCSDYGLWFVLNHNKSATPVSGLPSGEVLIDDRTGGELPGFGVMVIKENYRNRV